VKHVKGFTLVELLTTLAILGILVSVGIPALAQWVNQNKISTYQHTLLHIINYARAQGISQQATVTLCPGIDQCQRAWGADIIIFSDLDSNGVLEDTDQLLKKVSLGEMNGNLDWRSFRRKNYLQFNSEGLTRALNGTFHYCHSPTISDYNFAIALSRTGRARIHTKPKCP